MQQAVQANPAVVEKIVGEVRRSAAVTRQTAGRADSDWMGASEVRNSTMGEDWRAAGLQAKYRVLVQAALMWLGP